MKAISILTEISNDWAKSRNYVDTCYEGYNNSLDKFGYNPLNYEVVFHDNKIKDGDSVFVTDAELSKKANIILVNKENSLDKVYLYKIK